MNNNIKTAESAMIKDSIKSKYLVSKLPIKINVYFYEDEKSSLIYAIDKNVVSDKEHIVEWFEFASPTWFVKNTINANSVLTDELTKLPIVNPYLFDLARIMFLLKKTSLDFKIELGYTSEGYEYVSNIRDFYGFNDSDTAFNSVIVDSIKACIDSFYYGE